MAKKLPAHQRITAESKKKNITKETEIRGQCIAECDEAMIKMYRKIVSDLDRKEELEKELGKLTAKIAKLSSKEKAIVEDYLGKWPEFAATHLSHSVKNNLKKIAQQHNTDKGGAPVATRTTWTEDKMIEALVSIQGKADAKGFVDGKVALTALNAPSIDVLSQRLAGRTGDIQSIVKGKSSEPVIDAEHKVPKKEGARAKYKINVKKVLERLNG